jgi:hypothetical protein
MGASKADKAGKEGKAGVVLWLSADYKFLAMALGLKGATANHSCIFQRAPRDL